MLVDAYPRISETFVRDHARALIADGWTVTILAREVLETVTLDGGSTVEELERRRPQNVPGRIRHLASWIPRAGRLVATSLTTRQATYMTESIHEALERIRPDIVHAHFGQQGIAGALALQDLPTPLVTTFHGWDATSVPKREGWSAYRKLLGAGHAVAHSAFIADRLTANTRLVVHRVRMGVDTDLFHPPSRGSCWPASLRALIVGRLVPEKGHEVALEALRCLLDSPSGPRLTLRMLGSGTERERLEDLTARLGLTEHVEWLGARTQSEVAAEMRRSDLLLVPSVVGGNGAEEGFGRVALEGLSSGLPVIVSEVGGLPEAVNDVGWVVPPRDARRLAEAVTAVVQSDSPAAISDRARRYAETRPLQVMGDDYIRLAHDLIELIES